MRFLFLALVALALPFAASKQPNIVLIMTDDQGYGDLGVHGNTAIDTPRLDQFASESLVMERFYVNPLCSPTRASLMTGVTICVREFCIHLEERPRCGETKLR